MRLSVLIPSVHTRYNTFAPRLMDQIFGQWGRLSRADQEQVEIIILTDTKSMTIGDKRNRLLDLARGEYVVFIDDDDRLEDDYLLSVLVGTASQRDVVTFRVSVSLNDQPPLECVYSIDFEKDENTPTEYHRLPNHICAVRTDLARAVRFKPLSLGEDSDYASRLKPYLKTEWSLNRVLYYYDFNSTTTETQK